MRKTKRLTMCTPDKLKMNPGIDIVEGEVIRIEQPTTALAVVPKVQQLQPQEPAHDYEKQESILGKLIW